MTKGGCFFAVALCLTLACKQGDAARCARCGMRIDPASPWVATIIDAASTRQFDSPRCALATWLETGKRGEVRAQDYYDRAMRPASELRFVTGSDVIGPMGAELVPVDAARVVKFEKDHGGTRALAMTDIDTTTVQP